MAHYVEANLIVDDNHSINEISSELPVYESKDRDNLIQSIVLIEDALNFRSIFHKLDSKTARVYRLYYSNELQRVLYFTILISLILPFFENPSSLSISSDISRPDANLRYEFSCGVLESIDCFCLLIFLADALIKTYLISPTIAFRTPWLIAYYFVLIISFTDFAVFIILGCTTTIRIRAFLRPFFLVQCSSLMKKMIKCLKRIIPKIISVFVLLTIHVYFFAILGMHLFPRFYKKTNSTLSTNYSNSNTTTPNQAFDTIQDSLLNLLILLTTSNNPDVMMQTYSANRLSSLFFILYLIIGLYCIMSLVTAVIYNQFKGFFQDSMQSSAYRKSIALRAAFLVLYDNFKLEDGLVDVPKSCVETVIRNLSYISNQRKDYLIKRLKQIRDSENFPKDTVSLNEFETLFKRNINANISISDDDDEDEDMNFNIRFNYHHHLYNLRVLRNKLRMLLKTQYFMYFACLIRLANIICITLELHYEDTNFDDPTHVKFAYTILVFSFYYVVENAIKIWSFRWKFYLNSYGNIADSLITFCLTLLQIIHLCIYKHPYVTQQEKDEMSGVTVWGLSRVINMMVIFRLVDLAPSIEVMYAILNTGVDIIRSLKPLFGIIIVNYYIFALLGMQIFSRKVTIDSFNETYADGPDKYCGNYKQLDYWANNFDDFFSSLVVLWNLMVVNNWHVLFEAFVRVTNKWAFLYFFIWWMLSTVITLNVCVSMVLDLFVLKWEKSIQQSNSNGGRNLLIKSMHDLFNDSEWKPDEEQIAQDLSKHRFINFDRLIQAIKT